MWIWTVPNPRLTPVLVMQMSELTRPAGRTLERVVRGVWRKHGSKVSVGLTTTPPAPGSQLWRLAVLDGGLFPEVTATRHQDALSRLHGRVTLQAVTPLPTRPDGHGHEEGEDGEDGGLGTDRLGQGWGIETHEVTGAPTMWLRPGLVLAALRDASARRALELTVEDFYALMETGKEWTANKHWSRFTVGSCPCCNQLGVAHADMARWCDGRTRADVPVRSGTRRRRGKR